MSVAAINPIADLSFIWSQTIVAVDKQQKLHSKGLNVKICLTRTAIWNIDLFPFINTGRRPNWETSLGISSFFSLLVMSETACSDEH